MYSKVILSAVGGDRPGLTQGLAEAVLAAGGNWVEGHLSHLGGKFAGSILVELDADRLGDLKAAVQRLNAAGLHVSIAPAGEAPPVDGQPLVLELVGQDRPGIVHEVTAVLAGLGVNIEDLSTRTDNGAWSGERLFRAHARLTVPAAIAADAVIAALEGISGEIMVDFTITPA